MERTTKFTGLLIKHRWWVILISLLLTVAAGTGLGKIQMSTNYRVYFSDKNPEMQAFDKLQNVFTSTDNVVFVFKQKRENDVFNKETLKLIEEVTADSWKIPFSTRVDSLSNFQNSVGFEDDLEVGDLFENAENLNSTEIANIKKVAFAEPLLHKFLVSEDGRTTAVNVTIRLPGKKVSELPMTVAYVRKIRDDIRKNHPQLHVALGGAVMMNYSFQEAVMLDMGTLQPLMFLLLTLTLFFFVRSFVATIAPMVVFVLASAIAMGAGGYLGYPMTPPLAMAPSIIMTIAIADCIHILVTFLNNLKLGMDKKEALIGSMTANHKAIFFTSLTTAIGFLTLNFSESPPFAHLGNLAAIGVTMAYVFSVTLVPAVIAILPIRVPKKTIGQIFNMDHLSNYVIKHQRKILWLAPVVVLTMTGFFSRLVIDDDFVRYFDKEKFEYRRDTDFIAANLVGTYRVDYMIDSNKEYGINEPKYLKNVEAFTDWLRARPNTDHVSAYSDTVKRLNKNMHGDNPNMYKIPDDRELSAQYLELYSMSLPLGLDLNDTINIDKSAIRLAVILPNITTTEVKEFVSESKAWAENKFSSSVSIEAASPIIMFSHITEANAKGMITGGTLGLLLITTALMFLMRSMKFGFLSLIPNIVPILMGYGLWGLIYGRVGLDSSVAGAVCLGIIVDDTVHFIVKYLHARREESLSPEEAIRYTFAKVGPAIVITSIGLIVGFGVLSTSGFAINASFGKLVVMVISMALIADLLFLPPLLLKLEQLSAKKGTRKMKHANAVTGLLLMLMLSGAAITETFANDNEKNNDAKKSLSKEEQKGLDIALEVDKRDEGYVDSFSELRILLKNRQGDKVMRQLTRKSLEVKGGDKTLIVYKEPRDVKGIALLTFAHAIEDDDRWLFLPALKRVKRVSSKNKSGPFVGSEFAYEDLGGQEVPKYSYKWIADESIEAQVAEDGTTEKIDTFKIERRPAYKYSGYSKQVVWVDKADYRIVRIHFYDRKESHMKTAHYRKFKKYEKKHWRAHEIEMLNHSSGKSSTVFFDSFKFKNGFKDSVFKKNGLKRSR